MEETSPLQNNTMPHSTSMTSLKSSDASIANPELQRKAEEINLILLQPKVDLWRLRELALSEGGLVNGEYTCSVEFCCL